MQIAIGDVVRIRSDKELGTVAGVAAHRAAGSVVDVQMNGQTLRTVRPSEIEIVARTFRPMTGGRSLLTLLFFALGFGAAVVNGLYVHNLGANASVTVFVAFTSVTTVAGGLINLFNRPRRFRV
ncbi:hypothetical protein ACX6XY_14985 [Streptomyces sp. O3]